MTKVGTDKDYSNSSIPDEYLDRHHPEKVGPRGIRTTPTSVYRHGEEYQVVGKYIEPSL